MNYLHDLECGYTRNKPTIPRDKTMTSHRIVRFDLAQNKSNGLGYSAVFTTFQSCIGLRRDRTERPNRADRKFEKLIALLAIVVFSNCEDLKVFQKLFHYNAQTEIG